MIPGYKGLRGKFFRIGIYVWGGLIIVAESIALFLPMKSVFIVASGEVPSFFPWGIANLSPGLAAALLAAAAVVVLFVSRLMLRAATGLVSHTRFRGSLPAWSTEPRSGLPYGSHFLALGLSGAGALIILWPVFFVTAVATVGLWWFQVSRPRGSWPLSFSLHMSQEFSAAKKSIRESALPVAVLAGLLGSITVDLRFGLTQVLAAIVLSRLFQREFGVFLGYQFFGGTLFRSWAERTIGWPLPDDEIPHRQITLGDYHFFSHHLRHIEKRLSDSYRVPIFFRSVSSSGKEALLVGGDKAKQESVLVRLFSNSAVIDREVLAERRFLDSGVTPVPLDRWQHHSETSQVMVSRVKGFPKQAESAAILEFQRVVVLECVQSSFFQDWARRGGSGEGSAVFQSIEKWLPCLPEFTSISNEEVTELSKVLSELRSASMFSWTLPGVGSDYFLSFESGLVYFGSCTKWQSSFLTEKRLAALGAKQGTQNLEGVRVSLLRSQGHLLNLHRLLERGNFRWAGREVRKILADA